MSRSCKQATVYYGEFVTQPPGVSITVDADLVVNMLKVIIVPGEGEPRVTLEQALELLEAQWRRDRDPITVQGD